MARTYWKAGNMLNPVPVVMVSCQRPGEKPNIITIAWTGTICSEPAMLSISVRKERYSYDIIRETGEFVVNLVTEDLAFAADYCGARSGEKEDKFANLHLTPSGSRTVSAPGIVESPVSLECKVRQTIELGSHVMFLAEIMMVSVDSAYMDAKGKFRLNDTGLAVYSHGEYFTLGKKIGKRGYSVRKNKGK
ncbi:MAG: flavin reductase family protein [Clostridiales bacterium]|nr:flavin reductase family protein [Clostridiales bacterium]